MPRATCRCGQKLSLPVNGPDRVICPKCSAKVRVRRDPPNVGPGDGFVRFNCSCGRRLKVRAETADASTPHAGKCPDCGRVVPVPTSFPPPSGSGPLKRKGQGPETPTEELSPDDVAVLERWAQSHLSRSPAEKTAAVAVEPPPAPPRAVVKAEAGLRVCPRCGRPIHLSAVACRECGAPVPKR